jgi:putative ABC transport system ATP-binding protein
MFSAFIDPTGGRIVLGGEVIYENDWLISDLRALRRDKIGFIFQAPYLIPFISALDNVAILPMLASLSNAKSRERAMELLTALEVDHRSHAKPSELSGGEQQRVAIARALANKTPFLLADEPTAPLDSERSLIVMKLLTRLAGQYQTAIIVVTHDDIIIPRFKRLYRLRDGIAHEEAGQGLPFPD